MAEEKGYKIVVTTPAQNRYQKTILSYLMEHFSIERAAEVDLAIAKRVKSLSKRPFLGTKEKYLDHFNSDFRFILHKESRNFEIKIVYLISEENKTVYVTDFFPTRMNPQRMITI